MSGKKNIDRLFQEKLKDFEAAPSDAVWENINESLHGKKKKRRVIPVWWQLGGVAAALLLVLTLSGIFNTSENTDQKSDPLNTIVETDSKENLEDASSDYVDNSSETPSENSDNTLSKEHGKRTLDDLNSIQKTPNATLVENAKTSNNDSKYSKNDQNDISNQLKAANNATNSKTNAIASNTRKVVKESEEKMISEKKANSNLVKDKEALKKLVKAVTKEKSTAVTSIDSKENTLDNNNKLGDNNPTQPKEETITKDQIQDNAIEKALAEATKDNSDEKEKELKNRWSVAPNVAPVYFNSLGEGSSIHSQFNTNSKSGEINMSYGIAGAYAINNKLKVRAGVNKVNLGYSTNNVIAYSGPEALPGAANAFNPQSENEISNIAFRGNEAQVTYLSSRAISFASAPEILRTQKTTTLDQQFGFIEVPVELEYSIVDKKLGVNLIGGFSTMFLSDNEIYAVSENDRRLIGESSNLNEVSYSANFGIGLNYGISEKLNFNLEPMFKYQINTFENTSGDFQPYFIGVYTGLSFKF